MQNVRVRGCVWCRVRSGGGQRCVVGCGVWWIGVECKVVWGAVGDMRCGVCEEAGCVRVCGVAGVGWGGMRWGRKG